MTLQPIIEDLVVIADWRDDLASRVRRASLRFEFCGLDADEQEQLAAEVKSFNDVCCWLSRVIRSQAA